MSARVHHRLAAARDPHEGPVLAALVRDLLEEVRVDEGLIRVLHPDVRVPLRVGAVGTERIARIDRREHHHPGELLGTLCEPVGLLGVHDRARGRLLHRQGPGAVVERQDRAGTHLVSEHRLRREADGTVAGLHDDRLALRAHDEPRLELVGALVDRRRPEDPDLPLAVEGVRPRLRGRPADAVVHVPRGLIELDERIPLRQAGKVGDGALVLGGPGKLAPLGQRAQRLVEERRPRAPAIRPRSSPSVSFGSIAVSALATTSPSNCLGVRWWSVTPARLVAVDQAPADGRRTAGLGEEGRVEAERRPARPRRAAAPARARPRRPAAGGRARGRRRAPSARGRRARSSTGRPHPAHGTARRRRRPWR